MFASPHLSSSILPPTLSSHFSSPEIFTHQGSVGHESKEETLKGLKRVESLSNLSPIESLRFPTGKTPLPGIKVLGAIEEEKFRLTGAQSMPLPLIHRRRSKLGLNKEVCFPNFDQPLLPKGTLDVSTSTHRDCNCFPGIQEEVGFVRLFRLKHNMESCCHGNNPKRVMLRGGELRNCTRRSLLQSSIKMMVLREKLRRMTNNLQEDAATRRADIKGKSHTVTHFV